MSESTDNKSRKREKLDPDLEEKFEELRQQAIEFANSGTMVDLKDKYQYNQNPLFVWEVISFCLLTGVELPKWAQEYLVDVAQDLLTVDPSSVSGDQSRLRQAIVNAFKMSGNVFGNYHRDIRQMDALRLIQSRDEHGLLVRECVDRIASELNVEPETVRRRLLYD